MDSNVSKRKRYPWLNNFFGRKLNDDELRDISYPFAEVQLHATLKFAQVGAVIGIGIGEIVGFRRAKKFRSNVARTAAVISGSKGRNWMFMSGILSFPFCKAYYTALDYDKNDFYDRAYRLRNNNYQLRIDRGSLFGGLICSIALYNKGMFWYGFPIGMIIGITTMAAYNTIIYTNMKRIR